MPRTKGNLVMHWGQGHDAVMPIPASTKPHLRTVKQRILLLSIPFWLSNLPSSFFPQPTWCPSRNHFHPPPYWLFCSSRLFKFLLSFLFLLPERDSATFLILYLHYEAFLIPPVLTPVILVEFLEILGWHLSSSLLSLGMISRQEIMSWNRNRIDIYIFFYSFGGSF